MTRGSELADFAISFNGNTVCLSKGSTMRIVEVLKTSTPFLCSAILVVVLVRKIFLEKMTHSLYKVCF